MEAVQPRFEAANIRMKFEGPQSPVQLIQRLQGEIAWHANQEATFDAQKDFDQKAKPHHFARDQRVLFDSYFQGGTPSCI